MAFKLVVGATLLPLASVTASSVMERKVVVWSVARRDRLLS